MNVVELNLSEQASAVVANDIRFQTLRCCSLVETTVRLPPTGTSLQAVAAGNWADDV
jgi:hypothetical protein